MIYLVKGSVGSTGQEGYVLYTSKTEAVTCYELMTTKYPEEKFEIETRPEGSMIITNNGN